MLDSSGKWKQSSVALTLETIVEEEVDYGEHNMFREGQWLAIHIAENDVETEPHHKKMKLVIKKPMLTSIPTRMLKPFPISSS